METEEGLLVMGWRDSLEEDSGLWRVDIEIDPFAPSGQPLEECIQTVHVFV